MDSLATGKTINHENHVWKPVIVIGYKGPLTNARFVSGPSATTVTSPGWRFACSTRKAAADFSIAFPFGGGKFWFPSPSEPCTKSAIRSLAPFCSGEGIQSAQALRKYYGTAS